MASNTDIANLALLAIGQGQIGDLSDTTPLARQTRAVFALSRDATLRNHYWNEATHRVVLSTPLTPAPAFGFGNAFELPTDFLKVIEARDGESQGNYAIELHVDGANRRQAILTDFNPINLRYVRRIDADLMSANLQIALAYDLAMLLVLRTSQSPTERAALRTQAREYLSDARFIDSTDTPSRDLFIDRWEEARHGAPVWREDRFLET